MVITSCNKCTNPMEYEISTNIATKIHNELDHLEREEDEESDYSHYSVSDSESSTSFSDDDDDDDNENLMTSVMKDSEPEAELVTKEEKRSGLFLSLEMVKALRMSTSVGKINAVVQDESLQKMIPRSDSVHAVQGAMIYAVQTKSSTKKPTTTNTNDISSMTTPKELFQSILASHDISWESLHEKARMQTQFVKGTTHGYTTEVMGAVKKGDVEMIRHLHDANPTTNFQLCNRFGESIVHAAARHGHFDMIQFLVEQCSVSLVVSCDGGRNPLHDSVWTGTPNFSCIEYMIQRHPELLVLSDHRGFIPLDYIPRDVYPEWNDFLRSKEKMIIPLLQSYLHNIEHM